MKTEIKALLITALMTSGIVCFQMPFFLFPGNEKLPIYAEGRAALIKIDELNYAARVREFFDGNLIPTDCQLWEHKSVPGLRGIFPIWVAGTLAVLSKSIAFPFLFFDCVLPFASILLFFYFFRFLTHRPWLSLSGSVMLYFYFDPGALPFGSAVFWEKVLFPSFYTPVIELERFPSPQFNFPLLVAFCFSLMKLVLVPRRLWIIFNAFFLALLIYSYVYYAALAILLLGIMILFAIIKRNPVVHLLLASGFLAIFLSIPYILMAVRASGSESFSEILTRFGLFEGRFIYKKQTVFHLGIAFICFFGIRNKKTPDFTLFAILMSGILLLNKQLFTGSNFHPMHWYVRILHPFSIIACVNLAGHILNGNTYGSRRYLSVPVYLFSALLPLALTASVFIKQIRYTLSISEIAPISAEETRLFDDFGGKHNTGRVILTFDTELIRKILIKTPADTYLPHFSGTLAPDSEIEDRLILAAQLVGVPREVFAAFLADERKAVPYLTFIFGNKYSFEIHRERQEEYRHTPEALELITSKYKIYVPPLKLEALMKRYDEISAWSNTEKRRRFKIDYLILGREKTFPEKNESVISDNFELVWRGNLYRIYRVKP